MQIKFGSHSIFIAAPAKLNLFLEILAKRSDGFHELETLMCPISLCDELEFRFDEGPQIQLQLELPENAAASADPAWQIPADDRNLVVRAIHSVRAALGASGGCQIRLKKFIPAAAGLGGGSSDAAAAVVAAILAWGTWDRDLAISVCNSLGSDIRFFLGDINGIGLAVATGRGEICEHIAAQPEIHFVVTHPPEGCPTPAVYAGYQFLSPQRGAEGIRAACQRGDQEQVGKLLFNSLQSSASQLTSWIEKQLKILNNAGCAYTSMSGSGSSCFALVTDTRRMSVIRRAALDAGLTRAYAVKSWYTSSIEKQIQLWSCVR